MAQAAAEGGAWLPVESNPDVFNIFSAKMGWPTGSFAWQDLLSHEDWAVEMIPPPVLATIMLYEITPAQEAFKATQEAARAAAPAPASPPFWMVQKIPNACGTIGLVHAYSNLVASGAVAVAEGTWLADYVAKAVPVDPVEREAMLARDKTLEAQHAEAVQGGQAAVVEDTDQHFVCFVERGGRLWELDGRKGGPIDHGEVAKEAILQASVGIMKQYMSRNPESLRFTM